MVEETPEKSAERPLECSECRKSVATLYTLVERGSTSHTLMCASCPQLERRLHGTSFELPLGEALGTQIVCPECGTTLTHLRSGTPLGCSQCYETFGEQILNELITAGHIPASVAHITKGTPLHLGRAPGEAAEISPTLRLQALNQALADTLNREDYEQAAWLRDQIKQLTEKSNDGQQPSSPPSA